MQAQSLIKELSDMKQTFDNCSSQFVWDNNEGYVPTDARKLQNFQYLTKECDILFDNAERFLAKHKPNYHRMESLMNIANNPYMYAARCESLIAEIERWRHAALLVAPGDLSTHNAYIIDTTMESVNVPEPVVGGSYEDKDGQYGGAGKWWQYQGLSKFGDLYFVSLRTHLKEHTWISKERWKQYPMTGYNTPQELSPRGRPRPPIIHNTTPER